MNPIIPNVRDFITSLEPGWTIVFVPIWQEIVFRYLPFRFWYIPGGNFLLVGIASNIAFAAIHWYFGIWFVLWAFVAGMFQWWVMTKFGLLAAIIIHAIVNVVDLTFGLRNLLTR